MKYVLVQVNVIDGDNGWIFDIEDHKENIYVMKILDLTPEEAMVINNQITVYEKTKMLNTEDDFCKIYRLIPENEFSDFIPERKLAIPEDAVIKCDIPNITTLKNCNNYKKFIDITIDKMEYVKKFITSHTEIDKSICDNTKALGFEGFYYHKELCDYIIARHKIFFFDVNIKEILSKIPYNEFEDRIKEKAYEIIQDYLKEICDNDIDKMDTNKIEVFFDKKSFYSKDLI